MVHYGAVAPPHGLGIGRTDFVRFTWVDCGDVWHVLSPAGPCGSRHVREGRGVMLSDMERYKLPDPTLRAYDRGLGTLSVSGEVRGYLASVVGEIKFPNRAPWPWFVVVWLDGKKERSFEDYGPYWCTVRELDAGYSAGFEPHQIRGKVGRHIRLMSCASMPRLMPGRWTMGWANGVAVGDGTIA